MDFHYNDEKDNESYEEQSLFSNFYCNKSPYYQHKSCVNYENSNIDSRHSLSFEKHVPNSKNDGIKSLEKLDKFSMYGNCKRKKR